MSPLEMIEGKKYRRILKKMGYLADQQGIIDRYLREDGGWDSHLLRCREYILAKVELYSPETISILGSGWLLDVPLEEMAEKCRTINLIDIIHPSQIRERVKEMENVHLISDDITGGMIDRIWNLSKKELGSIDEVDACTYKPEYNLGMVVSLNVLTQTDTLIADYLMKKYSLSHNVLRSLRSLIQKAHLDFLSGVPGLLISDYEEKIIDKDKLLQINKLLFTDLPEWGERVEWEWDFDNVGEYYKRKRISFNVIAIDNAKQG